jgi:N-acetylneuraminate synthase
MAAVALGASVIEKHYTIDNRLPGPDHSFAITPDELGQMVRSIRDVERTLGDGVKGVLSCEEELANYARRGVQVTRPVARGDVLKEGVNIAILRPGQRKLGVHPRHLGEMEGKRAKRDIGLGEGIQRGDWE